MRFQSIFKTTILLVLVTASCDAPSTTIPSNSPPANTASPVPTTQAPDSSLPAITPAPSETIEAADTSTPVPSPSHTPTASPSPTMPPNNVTGNICFPDGEIPEMTVYLEETDNENLVEIGIDPGQTSYETDVEPGTYIAYAWLKDFSRGGLYSRAVPCGMGTECEDHSVLAFTVEQREVRDGIDICDWFAGPFNVPYPPGAERTELTGNVNGSISYIEGQESPGLRVVAFSQDTEYWYWVYTQPGQTTYTLTDLPPGTYHLVAYDGEGRAGAYANSNHDLTDVVVNSGETTPGVNITDWQAPHDTFPPDPTR
ncbi:MAG TPA: hypothetical protein VIK64_00780 [Anaerolineales bacterium]